MNPPTEISPSTRFLLDEIHRRFDEFDAWIEQRFSRAMAALEPWDAAVEIRIDSFEQFGATPQVEADNSGGWFEEPVRVMEESVYEQRPAAIDAVVVPDNWGGLFEQPAHTVEERDLFADDGFAGLTSTGQIRIYSGLTSTNSVASACSTPAPLVSAAAAVSNKEKEPVETSPAEYQSHIQEIEKPPPRTPASEKLENTPPRTPASEKFVSFALDAACDFSAAADRSIDLAATPRVSLLTIPKPVASDCDGTAVDWLEHACEVEPSTDNLCLLTDFISPTLCRVRRSPAFLRLDPRRRRPLRRLVCAAQSVLDYGSEVHGAVLRCSLDMDIFAVSASLCTPLVFDKLPTSPVMGGENLLEVMRKNLKKNNVALVVVYLEEFDGERHEKLEAIVAAASGASGFEFGVDTELALALQISMEEERARQDAAAKQAGEESSKTKNAGFPVVIWLPNWLCFHLLWKPPWQLPAQMMALMIWLMMMPMRTMDNFPRRNQSNK